MIDIGRREFIKLSAALAVSSIAAPAFAIRREPYVIEGESVDSIIFHLWDDPRNPAPFAALFVEQVLPWDGVGYRIVLKSHGYRAGPPPQVSGFYDFEWSNLRRDVPARFWGIPGNSDRYPNVHAYVREQRFGEDPDVMRQRMAANAGRAA